MVMERDELINDYFANIVSDIRALKAMLEDIRDDRENPYRIHAAQVILEHMFINANSLETVIQNELGII